MPVGVVCQPGVRSSVPVISTSAWRPVISGSTPGKSNSASLRSRSPRHRAEPQHPGRWRDGCEWPQQPAGTPGTPPCRADLSQGGVLENDLVRVDHDTREVPDDGTMPARPHRHGLACATQESTETRQRIRLDGEQLGQQSAPVERLCGGHIDRAGRENVGLALAGIVRGCCPGAGSAV